MLFDDTKKGRVNRMILPPFVITLKPAEAGSFVRKLFSLEGFKVLHVPPFLLVDVVLFLKGFDVAFFPFG